MLQTNLKHILSRDHYEEVINSNDKVMICCGRMGPMCVPVYASMKELEGDYADVAFYDMEFDHPDASVIRNLSECRGFMGLPFTVYYKGGEVVAATSSIQSKEQISSVLDEKLARGHWNGVQVQGVPDQAFLFFALTQVIWLIKGGVANRVM